MKDGYDQSRIVTTTRAVLLPADEGRTSIVISSPGTNIVRLSTRAGTGEGGFIIQPLQQPLKLSLD